MRPLSRHLVLDRRRRPCFQARVCATDAVIHHGRYGRPGESAGSYHPFALSRALGLTWCKGLGKHDRTIEELEAAFVKGEQHVASMAAFPGCDMLRSHRAARYEQVNSVRMRRDPTTAAPP